VNLPTLLRTLPADPAPDADLLARYRAGRDAAAFAGLVRRHGPLVWAACRHQTRTEADADDCFQAVWLALARAPGAVRRPERLAAWLHAVAGRACGKLRRAAGRREARERRAAVAEAVLPTPTWDDELAALHREVDRLPAGERAAFVLCGLQGVGVTEAAARLGWKLGTLSGRLTRAKARLAGRLAGRAVVLGPVPAAALAAAAGWATGAAAPRTVLSLSTGVVMGANRVRLLIAGLLAAGGLGAGGVGWRATAQQPQPASPPPKNAAELPRGPHLTAPIKSAKWEFHYHPLRTDEFLTRLNFEMLVARNEADGGWEFAGTVPANIGGDRGPTLVFRRPLKGDRLLTAETVYLPLNNAPADDVATLKARIAELEARLTIAQDQAARSATFLEGVLVRPIDGGPAPLQTTLRLTKAELPLDTAAESARLLTALAVARPAGAGGQPVPPIGVRVDGDGVVVTADKAGCDWLLGVVKALRPQPPGPASGRP
jgi:RNA polymerase sigma factor (sigma-70 family)